MPLITNAATQLVDQFGRHKHKLRISLTDRCNFRCSYCMPDKPEWLAKKDILSFEELLKFCEVMVQLGIQHIRLTGGEPLMRQGVVNFIHDLNRLKAHGLKRISMTSNAFYLKKYAQELKQAGLDDLNISLDSIQADTFKSMTKRPLEPVLQGIAAAQQVGIPIKLNCVLVAGKNDHEIVELTQWAYQQNIELRFIEYMPLDQPEHWQPEKVITEDEIIQKLSAHFQIEKQQRQHDPATIYRLNDHYKLGIISTISKPFCQTCNRLRLTATGELFTCLFANSGTPLRNLLQQKDSSLLTSTIMDAVWHKKAGFIAHQQAPSRKISMHAIGG
ncbi:GTP 3',8-cyclase MoaA [Acinetobacter sp. P8-3-8]|uniref:GTP 3',8-cyclase MoaA n=1 Tax=Acinetobacter sp. P8-3-8 TaxID=1029823 RepID=UPI000495108F|nr:GTP 3',8-cyclase MoaA [Acinetobacter sp. P8-3-8]